MFKVRTTMLFLISLLFVFNFVVASQAQDITSQTISSKNIEKFSKEEKLQIIEKFLQNPMVIKHFNENNKDINEIKEVLNYLSDDKLNALAINASDVLVYGAGEETVVRGESDTAVKISNDWLKLGWAAVLIPTALIILLLLAI